jgi:hypothetical protein
MRKTKLALFLLTALAGMAAAPEPAAAQHTRCYLCVWNIWTHRYDCAVSQDEQGAHECFAHGNECTLIQVCPGGIPLLTGTEYYQSADGTIMSLAAQPSLSPGDIVARTCKGYIVLRKYDSARTTELRTRSSRIVI